jgi:molybdate transport system substrate-binding protein
VFAAASLTQAFGELATGFHARNPEAQVQFNFAGSPTLVTQLTQGARADVLATADTTNMGNAVAAGLVRGAPAVFAHNALEIAVAPGNPKHIESLADLARADVTLVLAAPQVPAGKYAAQALATAHVAARPRSLETDVESVLTKVEVGEADAGIVYTTDVRAAASKVEGVPIPDSDNVIADYPVAQLKDAPNPTAAAAFIAYLRSTAGRDLLRRYGFQPA